MKKIFIYVQIIRLLQLHISNFITNRALDELRIQCCLYTRHIKKMPNFLMIVQCKTPFHFM